MRKISTLILLLILLNGNVSAADWYDDNITLDVGAGCIANCFCNGRIISENTIDEVVASVDDNKKHSLVMASNDMQKIIEEHIDTWSFYFDDKENKGFLVQNCRLIMNKIVEKAQEKGLSYAVELILNKAESKTFG